MSEALAEHYLAWDRIKSIKAQVHRLERTLEAGELKFSGIGIGCSGTSTG